MREIPRVIRKGRAALMVGMIALVAFTLQTVPAAAGTGAPTTTTPQATAPATAPATASSTAPVTAATPLALPRGITANTPPEPHVISIFADQLTGPRRAAVQGRGLTVPVRTDIDGCDRNYGEAAQCVPKTLPGGQTDLCAYLAQRGIKGIRVKGPDARGIDRNGNKIACD